MTDLLVYSIIIPVIPFRLEALGYNGVSSLVSWLVFAFVCTPRTHFFLSLMLIVLPPSLVALWYQRFL